MLAFLASNFPPEEGDGEEESDPYDIGIGERGGIPLDEDQGGVRMLGNGFEPRGLRLRVRSHAKYSISTDPPNDQTIPDTRMVVLKSNKHPVTGPKTHVQSQTL